LAHDWSGFYLGAFAGVAWADADIDGRAYNTSDEFPISSDERLNILNDRSHFSFSDETGIFGLQTGFNMQHDSLVFGIHADFGKLNLDGDALDIFGGGDFVLDNSFSTDWMLTLRPRVGLAFDSLLVYATGGAALLDVNFNHEFSYSEGVTTGGESFSESKKLWGWVAGGGAEFALSEHCSFGAEYLYADFETFTRTQRIVDDNAGPYNTNFEHELDVGPVHSVRAFVNFRL
jgi:outer membrane immunogenic protein